MAFMTDTPEDKPIAVPAYSSSGIFGEDVNDVRQQIAAQQQNNALAFANMPRGRGPVYAAALAGQQLGAGISELAGVPDPRVAKAQKLQEAQQEVQASGADLLKDPDSYYKTAYASLAKRGLYQEAAKVHDIMVQQDMAQSQLKLQQDKMQMQRYEGTPQGIVDKQMGRYVPGETGTTLKANLINMGPPGLAPNDKNIQAINANDPAAVKTAIDNGWVKYAAPGSAATVDNRITLNNEKERYQTLEDINREQLKTATSKATAAQDLLTSLSSYNSILDSGKFEPGMAADFRGMLGKAAAFFGYPELAAEANSNPGDFEALKGISARLVAEVASKYTASSKVSGKVLDAFKKTVPGIGETYAGNYVTNALLSTAAKHDIERRDAFIDIAGQTTKDEQGRTVGIPPADIAKQMNDWDNAHPLTIPPEVIDKAKRHAELMEISRSAPEASRLKVEKPDGTLDWKATPGKYYKLNGMLVKLTDYVDTKVRTKDGNVVTTKLPNFEVVK